MTNQYELTWNGCIPVTITAENEQEAKERFAADAHARGHHSIDPADVEVVA